MAVVVMIQIRLLRGSRLLAGVLFTPLFVFGGVAITPDSPLLFFWSLYLVWLIALHRRLETIHPGREWRLWILGGLLLGAGILSKYTMVLAVPAGLLSLFARGAGRWADWWQGYLLHGLIAALATAPIVAFNWQHDFAPLRFQWEHATQAGSQFWKTLGDFVGVQILLFGTLPIVLLPWVLWRWRSWTADPVLRVAACLFAFPMALFLVKATRGPLEGNWALVAFLSFWPLARVWFQERNHSPGWLWAGRAAFLPCGILTLMLLIHLVIPLPFIPPNSDRITRQWERHSLVKELQLFLNRDGEKVPVFTPVYQWTALLRFSKIDARHEPGISRPSHFTQSGDCLARHNRVYYFSEFPLPDSHAVGFDPPRKIARFPLSVRGEPYDIYDLWEYRRTGEPHAPRTPIGDSAP
jgi:hypothetical protein